MSAGVVNHLRSQTAATVSPKAFSLWCKCRSRIREVSWVTIAAHQSHGQRIGIFLEFRACDVKMVSKSKEYRGALSLSA